MAATQLHFRLKVRWWLKAYLYGVLLTARIIRRAPDMDRVSYWIGKGVSVSLIKPTQGHADVCTKD